MFRFLNGKMAALAFFIAVLFVTPANAQTAACKGLGKSQCSAKDSCSYVKSFTRSDGTKVKAFCRKKPGKGASSSSTKKKAVKKKANKTESTSSSSTTRKKKKAANEAVKADDKKAKDTKKKKKAKKKADKKKADAEKAKKKKAKEKKAKDKKKKKSTS